MLWSSRVLAQATNLLGNLGQQLHVRLPASVGLGHRDGRVIVLHSGRRILDAAQGGEEGLLGGGKFLIGDLAPLAGLQLGKDLPADVVLLVEVNARGYQHNALGGIIAGADGVAEALLFPHILEKLGGHVPAKDAVCHLHGGKPVVPIGDGGEKSHAELPLGHLHGFPPVLPDSGRQVRLPGHFPGLSDLLSEHPFYKVRHPARIGGANVIDLHRTLPAESLVVAEKLLRRDGLHLLPGAHLGHPVGVLAAEGLQQLLGGIDPLVIEL